MKTESTTTQISTVSANDSQQFSRSITIHQASNVSSVKSTASAIVITQLLQSKYLCSNYTYIIITI